jgi:hypothetical protein
MGTISLMDHLVKRITLIILSHGPYMATFPRGDMAKSIWAKQMRLEVTDPASSTSTPLVDHLSLAAACNSHASRGLGVITVLMSI